MGQIVQEVHVYMYMYIHSNNKIRKEKVKDTIATTEIQRIIRGYYN